MRAPGSSELARQIVNVAVTNFAEVIATVHAPVPLHAPLQLKKTESAAADGKRVTEVPELYAWVQSLPQSMPLGSEVTVPLPVPLLVTVSVYVGVNVAITAVVEVI